MALNVFYSQGFPEMDKKTGRILHQPVEDKKPLTSFMPVGLQPC